MVGERHIGWEGITSLRLDLDKPLVRVDWMELGKGTIHIGKWFIDRLIIAWLHNSTCVLPEVVRPLLLGEVLY